MHNLIEGLLQAGIKQVSDNSRRIIWEKNYENSSIQFFLIKPNANALGNHYHAKKNEVFTFHTGGGTLQTLMVDPDGKPISGLEQQYVQAGDNILIDSHVVHRFDLEGGTIFECWSSKPFDPSDLIKYELPDPK